MPLIQDATEWVRRLREREITAEQVTREAIEQAHRLNPQLNAIVTFCETTAMETAAHADAAAARGEWLGPLHGLPILVKDLFDFLPGVSNSFGCRAMTQFMPPVASAHVARLQAAGAIIIGKTNTPEFGHKGVTDNFLAGPTRCPFDHGRNAGGSSGGSAAAVAAGIVTLAQGSDAGGSIRIPAAWSGVCGLKPTYGRVPNTGGPNAFGAHTPFVSAGPLATTVRDLALAASVLCGPHDDDPFSLPDDRIDWIAALHRDARPLRIAFSPDLGGFAVEDEVAQAVQSAVEELRAAGLSIEPAPLRLSLSQDDLAQLWRRQVGAIYVDVFANLAEAGYPVLEDHPEAIPAEVHALVALGSRLTVAELKRDEAARSVVWREIQACMAQYNVLLTPTVGAVPVANATDGQTLGPASVAGQEVERTIGWCLTHPFNFTGHPAASLPAAWTPQGLPVGLQIVGRRFRDDQVLSVGAFIERVCPWQDRLQAVQAELRQSVA